MLAHDFLQSAGRGPAVVFCSFQFQHYHNAPLKAILQLKTNGKLPVHRARSLRWMRTGVFGRRVIDSRWRSIALISRSSSRTLGRSPLTCSVRNLGEILGDLLLLAEGCTDGGPVLRVERECGGASGSAGGGAGWVKPRS